MRLIKMLGLAVVSVLVAMALASVGTASADSLCEVNVNHSTGTCSNPLTAGNAFLGLTLAGAPWTFLAGVFEVKCHSTLLGLVGANEGSHVGLWALLDSLTFSNCVGSCTGADGLGEPYLLLGDALELHVLITKHASGGTPQILLTGCALGDCTYDLVLPHLLNVVGDTLVDVGDKMTRKGGLCPATGEMDATYLLTLEPPSTNVPIYLVSLP